MPAMFPSSDEVKKKDQAEREFRLAAERKLQDKTAQRKEDDLLTQETSFRSRR